MSGVAGPSPRGEADRGRQDPGKRSRALDRRVRWSARLGTILLHVLGRTWRVRFVQTAQYRERRAAGHPAIFVLWHGQLLPLLFAHRKRGIAILISDHADGEIVARVALNLGLRLVRGSSSQGGARALVGLVRELRSGSDVAITPDGPRGPARSVAPGALMAAQRSGSPLMPLGVSVSRAWRLRTWDGFLIPKPFARITIAYGPLASVDAGTPRAAGEEGAWLHGLMDDAERLAIRG